MSHPDPKYQHEKSDTESMASVERPIPIVEAWTGDNVPIQSENVVTTQDARGMRYQYLTFDTVIPFEELASSHPDASPPPNLRKFESPFGWTSKRKLTVLILSCCCTFCAAYSAGAYSIAAEPQRERWNLSVTGFATGITAWAMGFAVSPMFLAPFSEINGRRPVFIGSAVMFLIAQVACAVTPSFAVMLVFRFFVGAGASTFATIIGGVISDMYHAQDRNAPMAIYSASALAGTGFGLLVPSFIIGRVDYRWVYYHQIIYLGFLLLVLYFFFSETRGSVLLSRKAKILNRYLDDLHQRDSSLEEPKSERNTPEPFRYKVEADENRSSIGRMLYISLTLPFTLLATEPVVFFFSLWASFAWAVLYMTFSVLPLVFTTRHNFNTEQNGAVFSAVSIGTILAAILSIYQEKLAKRRWPKLSESPEGRLYFACLESALLPIGLFWFGWTTSSSIHWISPVLAIGCAQIGIFSIYLAVFNYLADVYHRYASSALAAQGFMRNLMAAIFPLFTNQMFTNLGYAQASSLLGGISALLTLVPWVLLFNGEKIRARSKIASEILATAPRT